MASSGGIASRCATSCACTLRTAPHSMIIASSACRPAPVKPPPGDSADDVRQPPLTRFEFSLLLCPSMCRSSPSSPLSTRRFSACIAGQKRRLWPTARTTPVRRHASSIARASAAASASGFSQNTCLPACAAAIACSRCSECGVASTTAWTESSRSTCEKWVPSAGSAEAVKRMRSPLPATDSIRLRPQRPSPTIAAFTTRDSFRLDAGLADVARPFLDLLPDVVAERLRSERRRIDAERGEARLELGLRHRGARALVDAIQRLARRTRGRDQPVPQHHLVAWDLLADRGNVGRERGAARRRDAKGAELAALHLAEPDGEIGEGEADLAGEQVGHRRRHALVGHIDGRLISMIGAKSFTGSYCSFL